MKQIITILLAMMTLTSVLTSCKKGIIPNATHVAFAHFEFSVGEQESVSHYIVQISLNGKDWENRGIIFATENMEETYETYVRVDQDLQVQPYFYTRIVSRDIDGKTQYSEVSKVDKI